MTALALAAFVAGAWLLQQQAALPPLAWQLGALVGGALGLALAWRLPDRPTLTFSGMRAVVAALAGLALGFGHAAWRADLRLADALAFVDEGRDVVIVGIVDSLPAQLDRGQRFEFAVERSETPGVPVPARIALSWFSAQAGVQPAERWRFTVRLRRPHGSFNPGGFDLEAWMLERHLRASGYVRDGGEAPGAAPQRLAAQVADPGASVDRLRHHLRALLQQRLGEQRYAGVLVALVLGDQRAIDEADWQLFNATGISHLVSISGLHITMIAGLVALAAAAVWRRSPQLLRAGAVQTAAATAGMLGALAYCLLAGWGVPAQRTFFMLAVVALALLARVSLAPSLTLAMAAAVVTLVDPWASAAPGFWLSFGAVAAIFLAMQGQRGTPSGWRARLRAAAQVQLAVTVALVPLTIALFQQVSLVSPLANAVAIPVVSLVVTPLALLGGAFAMLPAPLDSLAVPCLVIGHALFAALAQGLAWLAGFGWAALPLPAPPPWALVFALAGVAWLLQPRGWPLRWLGLVWLLPLVVWPPVRPDDGEVWVTALDVGQGAAVLVETRDHALLYDTGPRYTAQADAGGRVILPYLRWRGIGTLDLLVVSHLDSDHSGGAASVLRGLPGTPVYTSIDLAHPMFRSAGPVRRCRDGERVELGGGRVELRFLHPAAADYDERRSTNAMSCVLLIQAGAHRLLLTGDLPARQEAQMLARLPPGALANLSLLAAPHHGSRNSSSAALIEATRPRWVLYQAGYRNRYGHPDGAVLAAYLASGARAARSDHHGAVQWRLRADAGDAIVVSAARQDRRRYWHNQPGAGIDPAFEATREVEADDAEPMRSELAPLSLDAPVMLEP